MTIFILTIIGVILYAFTEWANHEMEQERKARVEYVKQKQNSKIDFCAECYYKKTVTYSTGEKLWLCEGCK
ncbi:hypothetical protein M4D55_24955 [Metabacillus idriensis]|uniref:hypothetical protein n=1 Tax=Metabacillus idriensis TaxID=324768 RepID=UPI00203D24E4|nr:hypothetical protein [Metabacillus idriensis]MCM3598683.1 hypothetical protein [Metabacillus idriensis]MCM3598990.1 hypothetical protein [Metabacillus idriensis]